MTTPRRIAVVTGTRAEYGLLKGLIRRLHADPAITLQLVVTAAHLQAEFGETWREIEADGWPVSARVPMPLEGGTRLDTARALGAGTSAMAEALARLSPEVVVVLGDRIELLAVASCCLILGIPLAHIHGGEITEGAMDDSIRHALTKMAAVHFPAAPAYADRIRQMGEPSDRIILAGAPGLDNIAEIEYLDRPALEADLGLTLDAPVLLVTYHPETLAGRSVEADYGQFLAALERFPQCKVVITGANADPGGQTVNRMTADWVAARPGRAVAFPSLGLRRYLSVARLAAAVVGNSSSGIIEAPALGVPTVNVGDRQKGRLRAASILDCACDMESIAAAIGTALSESFRSAFRGGVPPYGRGGAGAVIHQALRDLDLSTLGKRFVDFGAETGRTPGVTGRDHG